MTKSLKITLLILLLMFDAINGQNKGLQEIFECGASIIEEYENLPPWARPTSPSQHRILLITPQEEYLYDRCHE